MLKKNIPRLVFWELTKKCNLSCAHCRAEAEEIDYSGELSFEQITSVIDNITLEYSPIIVLTGGEPLFRNDIYDIARYGAGKGLKMALATNGTLIDREAAEKIAASGISRVSISIDGKSSEFHDRFRAVKGAFDRALAGARFLKNAGVEFQFNTTITRNNVDQVEDIVRLAETEGAKALHIFMLVPVGCGIELAESDMISAEKYEEVLHWFYEKSKSTGIEIKATCAPHYYRIIRQRAREEGRTLSFETDGMSAMTRGCLAGTGVCFISNTGNVQPCGYLPVSAGNILENDFTAIWENSELFAELRDFSKLKGKCGDCEYKGVCGGCRARAYYESGDYLTPEPYCLYEPKKGS